MIKLDTILTQNKLCPVRTIEDGLLIMSADGTETHSLRDMGAFIWGHIDGKNDMSSIAQSILDSFDISEPDAHEDLIAFAIQLLDANLVTIQN